MAPRLEAEIQTPIVVAWAARAARACLHRRPPLWTSSPASLVRFWQPPAPAHHRVAPLASPQGPRYDMGGLVPRKEDGWRLATNGTDYALWVQEGGAQ